MVTRKYYSTIETKHNSESSLEWNSFLLFNVNCSIVICEWVGRGNETARRPILNSGEYSFGY